MGGDSGLTAEQMRYLDALSTEPYYANRVLSEVLQSSLAGSSGGRIRRISDSLARNCFEGAPTMQARPYFQILMDAVGDP